jgi:hypothetical protein
LLPTFVQVTRVLALMLSEPGLNEPPPPVIVMLALPVGLQLGEGLGLGEGLALGLGDGLALGEGLGLGVPSTRASDTVAPALRNNTPTMATANWIQNGCLTHRVCEERLDCADWSLLDKVVIIFL